MIATGVASFNTTAPVIMISSSSPPPIECLAIETPYFLHSLVTSVFTACRSPSLYPFSFWPLELLRM